MSSNFWKTIAIILIIIQILEISLVGWVIYFNTKLENEIKQCYYNICEEYPEASLENGVCYCYVLDVTGTEYIVDKTEIMA